MLLEKLFVLKQMLKIKMALFTFKMTPKPFSGKKIYVIMKMVRKSQRQITKMVKQMDMRLLGLRTVSCNQRQITKKAKSMEQ